jgi:hypothetical protein
MIPSPSTDENDVLTSIFESVENTIRSQAVKYDFSTSRTIYTYAQTVVKEKKPARGLSVLNRLKFQQFCRSFED